MIRRLIKKNKSYLALVALVVLLGYSAVNQLRPAEAKAWQPYTVQSGDTLWGIATQHRLTTDIRDTLDLIRYENKVDPEDLQPGMTIQVPVK